MKVSKFFSCFPGKAFWYGVLGTSQGGSHPRVGAKCYLLNKLISNKSTQKIYFLISDEDFRSYYEQCLGHYKVGISGARFLKKMKVLAFSG